MSELDHARASYDVESNNDQSDTSPGLIKYIE